MRSTQTRNRNGDVLTWESQRGITGEAQYLFGVDSPLNHTL